MQKQASEIAQKICRGRDGFGYAELQTLGLRLVGARPPPPDPPPPQRFHITAGGGSDLP